MRSPAGRSTSAQLTAGSAPGKIKPGLSVTHGGPGGQVLAQSSHGCAERGSGAAEVALVPSLLRIPVPPAPILHPPHPTMGTCPWPQLNFSPTRRPEPPDFSCTPHARNTPPWRIWQGGTPTQQRLAATKERGNTHGWMWSPRVTGGDSPGTAPSLTLRGEQGIPALGSGGRRRGAPSSAGCQTAVTRLVPYGLTGAILAGASLPLVAPKLCPEKPPPASPPSHPITGLVAGRWCREVQPPQDKGWRHCPLPPASAKGTRARPGTPRRDPSPPPQASKPQ